MRKFFVATAIVAVVGAMPVDAQTASIGKAVKLAGDLARSVKSRFPKWPRRSDGPVPGGTYANFVADLKSPKNYCTLARDGENEKLISAEFDKASPAALVITQYSVPCKELPSFWQGQEPSRWSLYNVSKSTLPKDATRMIFVVEMTKETPELKLADLDKTLKDMAAKKEEERAGIIESTSDEPLAKLSA